MVLKHGTRSIYQLQYLLELAREGDGVTVAEGSVASADLTGVSQDGDHRHETGHLDCGVDLIADDVSTAELADRN